MKVTGKITTTVEVDGEIYIFTIQREEWQESGYLGMDVKNFNDLTITSSSNMPDKIRELIDVMFDKASQLL